MRIKVTGPGRTGGLCDGVGKLAFSDTNELEAKQLLVVYQSVNDFSFVIPILWAIQNKKTLKKEDAMLEKMINRIGTEFLEFLGESE